jgi:hypothetical protein
MSGGGEGAEKGRRTDRARMIGSSNKNRVRRERHPHNVRLLNKLSRHIGFEESIIRRHTLMEETKLELTQHPLNSTTHPASSTVNTTSILHGRISRPRDASKHLPV